MSTGVSRHWTDPAKPPACGVYAEAYWDADAGRWFRRANAAGRAFLSGWLAAGNTPAGLVRTAAYSRGTAANYLRVYGQDEFDSACGMAAASAVTVWEPERGGFTTCLIVVARGQMHARLKRDAVRHRPAVSLNETDDDGSRRGTLADRLPGDDGASVHRGTDVADLVAAVLKRCPAAHRPLLERLAAGETRSDVEAAFGLRRGVLFMRLRSVERMLGGLTAFALPARAKDGAA